MILRAWPWPGALFLALAFLVTLAWLINEFDWEVGASWLEPLAALLGGLGAFIVAAILIGRKVQSASDHADCYEVSRGLAVGYYFNFIRPLVTALRDKDHAVHGNASARGLKKITGVIVGIPGRTDEFDPEKHDDIYKGVGNNGDIRVVDEAVEIAGRPRPVNVRLAINAKNNNAVIVDIPTTLAVIPDYAEFLAERDLADHEVDEHVREARRTLLMAHETGRFSQVIDEVSEAVFRVGAQEPIGQSPAPLCHIVPVSGLREAILIWTKS